MGKGAFDRVAVLVGMAVLLPVFVGIAAAVRIAMPDGGALFRQERIGRHGRVFRICKFRTMRAVHDGSSVTVGEESSPVTVEGDGRVTRLGAWLRRYKLDELPELWNVLRGEMSLVGPRPDVPGYADRLEGEDRRILELRPGITGPASLKYRREERLLASVDDPRRYNDEVIWPDKVRLNMHYLRERSFWLDLRIIFCTIFHRRMKFAGEEI